MSSKSSFYNSTGVTNTQSNAIDASVDNAEASAVASENSANSASASASTATTKASEASTSASTATTKASEASTSASTATTKASEASTSATTATTKATESANSATASANSATAASTSSSTATTKASEASSSASTALSHKNDAQTAKTAAETAETNAETAETNAASSATAASTSASSASTSATTATTKAGEAATSASTATTKANEAATSASNANTAASTATTKASEASTSANNAASSATAASASKDAALAALDNFDDRYLGVKSSNPTVDNDGNALVAGSLYFNSTDGMKVYEGSAWVAAYASLSGALIAASDLSDLSNVATARTNLGLGTAATTAATAYATAAQGTLATNALPKAGGTLTGNIAHAGTFTLDVGGELILDADTAGVVRLKDGGTEYGTLFSTSSDFYIKSQGNENNIIFQGNDSGGSGFTALTLDMSNAGRATFNENIIVTGTVNSDGLTVDGDATLQNILNIGGSDPQIRTDTSDGSDNKTLWIGGGGVAYSWNRGGFFYAQGNEAGGHVGITAGNVSGGSIKFTTGASEAMRITSAGQVGIGTSTFGATYDKLAVAGGINIQDDYTGKLEIGRYSSGVPNSYIKLGANSNSLRFTNKNDSADLLTIENGGSVGIGTSSPQAELHVHDPQGHAKIRLSGTATGADTFEIYQGITGVTNGGLTIRDVEASADRLVINPTGSVGIGTTSPSVKLHVDGAGSQPEIRVSQNSTYYTDYGVNHIDVNGPNDLRFLMGGSEKIRIDSSGNVLVGTTNDLPAINNVEGIALSAGSYGGRLEVSRAGGEAVSINRKTNDGSLMSFKKDGTTVGSIGAHSSGTYLGTADTGIYFNGGNDSIDPYNPSVPINRDNAISLGAGSRRFKDLYLSGGIEIENGTGNVGVGKQALNSNTASNNTAVGYRAGYSLTNAGGQTGRNTFVGMEAGYNSNGDINTFVGQGSGSSITSGRSNTILGRYNGNQGGLDIRTSSNNIVLSDGDGNPRVVVNSSGNLTCGATSSTFAGSSYRAGFAAANNVMAIHRTSGTEGVAISFVNQNNSVSGQIYNLTSSTSYNTSSDYRLKENVVYDWDATTRLKQLKPARFNFIVDADTTVDGFLAHEAQAVVPEAVTGTHNEVDADGNAVMQGIDQSKLVPLLVKTIQELEARITALENA